MFVCVFICCVGRGLCDGLITRPVETYQVSEIDYETPLLGGQGSWKDCRATDDDDDDIFSTLWSLWIRDL
jgi:hypothetical protein